MQYECDLRSKSNGVRFIRLDKWKLLMRKKGNSLDFAQCPNCDDKAKGSEMVKEKFGMRNNGGYIMVQSWCKDCR